jgi:putative hydrolase of the HAD superfamily
VDRPKGILFDFGGTLIIEPPFDPLAGTKALLEVARDRGTATAERIQEEAKGFLEAHWPTVERAAIEIPASSFRRLLYERFGVAFDRPDLELDLIFWQASMPRSEPEPGIHALLRAISVPRAIVSNNSFPAAVIRWELEHCGLDAGWEFIMATVEYGVRKPHPELFKTAAAKLGVGPEDIWFCGDRLDMDVAGALGAGMTAVWYAPDGREPEGPEPHIVVRHWDEIRSALSRRGPDR